MKKSIIELLVLFLFPFAALSQGDATTGGMVFEHLPSMESLFAKAKKENKLVFVDCYTTWCGPCKMMTANVFTKKEVADFYNANFVNAKIQMDETNNDNDYVKSWHKNSKVVADKYKVTVYPTYLIFNGDGEIVHRFVGGFSPKNFIAAGKSILNPEGQYYTQVKKYETGERSTDFLLNLIKLSNVADDDSMGRKLSEEYLSTQKDMYTKDNLELLYSIAKNSKDKGFEIAYKEGGKVDEILENPGASKNLVMDIIVKEELIPLFQSKETFDVNSFDTKLQKKYPEYAKSISDYAKMVYYGNNKNWDLFVQYADQVSKLDGNNFNSPYNLNQYALRALTNISDKKSLEKAAGWAKLSIKKDPKYATRPTYAYLLYKLGKKDEAITEAKKVLALVEKEGGKIEAYQKVVEKMEKGEPTWPEKK